MIGPILGGIAAVAFALIAGLVAGNMKNRQKNRDDEYRDLESKNRSLESKNQSLESLLKNAQANASRYSVERDEANLKSQELQRKLHFSDSELKRARQSNTTKLTERIVERYENGKMAGRTGFHFDEAGNPVEVKSNYDGGMSQEELIWHELDHLAQTAQDSYSANRYKVARNTLQKPEPQQWTPRNNGSGSYQIGHWVHWKTKEGTKSKRPSPILKTRMGEGYKHQVLLTFVSNKGKELKQFWCDADRCERVSQPTVFAGVDSNRIVQLCTKNKQVRNVTELDKSDFRAKLKGLYVAAKTA